MPNPDEYSKQNKGQKNSPGFNQFLIIICNPFWFFILSLHLHSASKLWSFYLLTGKKLHFTFKKAEIAFCKVLCIPLENNKGNTSSFPK